MAKPLSSLILAERSVPRYTSYPTAPHFHAGVNAQCASEWLRDIPAGASLSLYLHVPFCTAICNYCGCNTKAVRREEPVDAYTETLLHEIDLVAKSLPPGRVSDIHWGGGTPSLLGPKRLLRLWARLKSTFDIDAGVEHAIELDPRTVDEALVDGLAAAGITRASLGVQDMNHHVQEAIGRVQPFETVEHAVKLLRGAGIAAINLDLMYGLPLQTLEDVKRSAEMAASLVPSRFAIFGYAHVPWFKVHQRLIDAAALPGAAERIAQAEVARQTLVDAGYEAIGLDHFAHRDDPMAIASRAGTLRRNFQGYTTDQAEVLLPFGSSSIGRLPQGYVQNASDIGTWRRAIEGGQLAVARGIAFSQDDLARGAAIERLMCDYAVDYGAVAQGYLGRADALDDAADELSALERDGVVEIDGRVVTVTQDGQPYVRLVAAAFDSYFKASAARHSMAV